jgi:acetyltransferase
MTEIVETAEVIAEISEKVDIPILASFMGEARVEAGIKYMAKYNVPNFAFPERAAMVLQAMSHYREYRAKPLPSFESFDVDQKAVRETIDRVLDEGRLSIGDAEAKSILTAYGLQAPPSEIAETAEKAVEIAADMGYPVVLKIASPDILHKTDVGGVKVGLQNPTDVRDAFDLITYRSQRYLPEARLWGCQVQKMVPSGLEILIGMNRDPQFGPLVTFGLGGIYVEALKDASFRIAPFSRDEAAQMLTEIRAKALLDGVRGEPPVDKETLIEALLRIGQLVLDFPEIAELDINPLIVYEEGRGGVALDMRLILLNTESKSSPEQVDTPGSFK